MPTKTNLYVTDKKQYVDSVLNANKDKDWVRRLTMKNTPSIQVKGQKYRSTHLMSDNDNGYVFPSIQNINGKLTYLGDRAEDYARETNTGIQLPKEQGTWFARSNDSTSGYKMGTGVLKEYATGGQLKAQNNAGMIPYLYNSLPQYGLGSWLAENAGTIGTVAGGIIGSVIPGAGTALGASIGGGLGSLITNSHNQGEANDQKAEQAAMQQQQLSTQNAMNNYNAQQRPMYGANFAMGGFMPNVNTWQYSNVGGMNYGCGGKMANGGQLGNDNGAAQMTKGLDNITVYPKSAGSHEDSKYSGIKVGNKGLTEGGETRVNGYIFSNRF